jgi:hypothetical protein
VATLPRPQLFSRNADVDRVNAAELARLPGTLVTCQALDGVTLQEDKPESSGGGRRREPLTPAERQRDEERLRRHEFFRDCLAAQTVQLKVGAQVHATAGTMPRTRPARIFWLAHASASWHCHLNLQRRTTMSSSYLW